MRPPAKSQERIVRCGAIFALACALLLARLFELQALQHGRWEEESARLRMKTRSVPYLRGPIVDRNGLVLVEDRDAFDLRFQYRAFRRGHPLGQVAHLLALLSGRPVTLREVAEDPGRFALAASRTAPRHLAGRRPSDKRDAIFYLARLLSPAAADATVSGERRLALESRLGGDEPFAARLGVAPEAIEARIRGSLADLEPLEAACGWPRGTLLARAEARRVGIEEAVEKERATGDGASRRPAQVRGDFEMRSVLLEGDAPFEGVSRVALEPARFAGFTAETSTRRSVSPGAPVSIVGLAARPSADDLERKARLAERLRALLRTFERTEAEQRELEELSGRVGDFDSGAEDAMGRFGLEAIFDGRLRGRRGSRVESIDGAERKWAVRREEPAVDGKRLALALDAGLQRAAEEAFREGFGEFSGIVGAAVVLDPRQGDVLALASSPSYSEEEYRSGYGRLDADPLHPLKNRAFDPWVPPAPGSVFKVVTAAAALEEGVASPETILECAGLYEGLHCHLATGHGALDLGAALEHSCNVYFYRLGERLGTRRLGEWARRFGFGEETGIELPEVRGAVREDLADAASARRFAIGQAMIAVSPLQVARMIAAMANGGRLVRPRLVLRVGSEERPVPPAATVPLSGETLSFLHQAMRRVVETGTARPRGGFDLRQREAAGKTGTAEVGGGEKDHSWFAGYAPAGDPRLAIVVYCEKVGVHGGDLAAPLADRILGSPAAQPYLTGARSGGSR